MSLHMFCIRIVLFYLGGDAHQRVGLIDIYLWSAFSAKVWCQQDFVLVKQINELFSVSISGEGET